MKYTYIKQRHGKTEETVVKFVSDSEERSTHMETEIKSEEGAAPEFIEAMKAMKPFLLEHLELPKEYGEGLEVHTLNFRHSSRSGRWSVQIIGSKTLETNGRPFNISSPLINQPADNDGYGKKGNLSRDLEQKILAVMACADDFRKGERAQQEMALENGGEKTTGRTVEKTPIEKAAEGEKSFRPGEVPDENTTDEPEAVDETETPATPFDDDVIEGEDEPESEDQDEQDDNEEEEAEAGSEAEADTTPPEEPTDPTTADTGTGLTNPPAKATSLTETKLREAPTAISILKREGIEDTVQLYERRDECAGFKGVGPATLEMIDEALAEAAAGHEDAREVEPEDRVLNPEGEPVFQVNSTRTDTGHAFLEFVDDIDQGIVAKIGTDDLEWSEEDDAWKPTAAISRIKDWQARRPEPAEEATEEATEEPMPV